jgi:hypothetical protein
MMKFLKKLASEVPQMHYSNEIDKRCCFFSTVKSRVRNLALTHLMFSSVVKIVGKHPHTSLPLFKAKFCTTIQTLQSFPQPFLITALPLSLCLSLSPTTCYYLIKPPITVENTTTNQIPAPANHRADYKHQSQSGSRAVKTYNRRNITAKCSPTNTALHSVGR